MPTVPESVEQVPIEGNHQSGSGIRNTEYGIRNTEYGIRNTVTLSRSLQHLNMVLVVHFRSLHNFIMNLVYSGLHLNRWVYSVLDPAAHETGF